MVCRKAWRSALLLKLAEHALNAVPDAIAAISGGSGTLRYERGEIIGKMPGSAGSPKATPIISLVGKQRPWGLGGDLR